MKEKRIFLYVFLLILAVMLAWLWFFPVSSSGRVRATWLLMKWNPSSFYREIYQNFVPVTREFGRFYLSRGNMPSPQELEYSDAGSATGIAKVWAGYEKNQLWQSNYYNYGSERGECTFVVEGPSGFLDQEFHRNLLPIVNETLVELEHRTILARGEEGSRFVPPQFVVFQPVVVSPICLYLTDVMPKEDIEEIQNELLKEIEEGTYEKICVFSKPFQDKLARRKKQEQKNLTEASPAPAVQ